MFDVIRLNPDAEDEEEAEPEVKEEESEAEEERTVSSDYGYITTLDYVPKT